MRLELAPLRERNFRLLAGARTISFFGTNLAPIAVAFAVLDLTGSATDVGIAFAVLDAGAGLDAPDRRRRRRPPAAAARDDQLRLGELRACGRPWALLLVSGHARDLGALRAAGARRRSDRLLLAGVDRARARKPSRRRLLQQANAFMGISRYARLSARRGGRRRDRRDDRERLRPARRRGDLRDERTALEPDPPAGRARSTAAPNFVRELREGWQAFTEHTWVWLLTALDLALLPRDLRAVLRARAVHRQELAGRRRRRGRSSSPVRRSALWRGASSGSAYARAVRCSRSAHSSWSTALQCALLAVHAPALAIGVAAMLAGLRVLLRHRDLGHGAPAGDRAGRSSRASAPTTGWARWRSFLPGTRLPGPWRTAIGMSTSLWIGVVWIVVTTLAVLSVRDVRDFRLEPATEKTELAAAPVAG